MSQKQVCHECNGSGQVRANPGSNFKKNCKICNGTGYVPFDGRYSNTKTTKK